MDVFARLSSIIGGGGPAVTDTSIASKSTNLDLSRIPDGESSKSRRRQTAKGDSGGTLAAAFKENWRAIQVSRWLYMG